MASLSSLALTLSLALFFSLSSAALNDNQPPLKFPPPSTTPLINEACKASNNPIDCATSIANFNDLPPSNPTVLQVMQAAVGVSLERLDIALAMVKDKLVGAAGGDVDAANAGKICTEVLGYTKLRMASTVGVLTNGKKINDARAWMSAALGYQHDCWSVTMNYVHGTSKVSETIPILDSLIALSSDALSMLWNYEISGEKTMSWGIPKTERDGVWEKGGVAGGGGGAKYGVPAGLKADVTVCKTGGCKYKAVQEAVNAAPSNLGVGKRFVIGIKAGVYEEIVIVPFDKKNVVFLGDGMGKTVITGSLNVGQPGMTTFYSATVAVAGDGFMATGVTFQNTAGSVGNQAVAFRSDSDLSVVENCEFIGNQDTLYTHTLRQFYKSCRIQGNVDFIFGYAAAFFQDCLILVAPRQPKPEKEQNAVTAHGRIDPAQATGFVFQNCTIKGSDDYMKSYNPALQSNFLGRPWKEFSRTVFIQCTLEAIISPEGWLPWSGEFALKTLYYGEFQNKGPGAKTSARVKWSSQIPAEHVNSYTVQSFIQGDQWISISA